MLTLLAFHEAEDFDDFAFRMDTLVLHPQSGEPGIHALDHGGRGPGLLGP